METAGESFVKETDKTCIICKTSVGKYTCPRCNILYCSLGCYKDKSHTQCSEQFYQQCVREELSLLEGDSESKKKMEQILRNARSFCDDEDEEEEPEEFDSDDADVDEADLAERLKGIDMDDSDAVWERLTEAERQHFSKMVTTGHIRETLPAWDPWWLTGLDLPPLASDIPPMTTLTGKIPSPALPFLVMNTVAAYQLSLRLVRGQSDVLCVEAATAIWNLSSPLRGSLSIPPTTMEEALTLVLQDCAKCTWMEDVPTSTEEMTEDLRSLTATDSCFLLLALSHIKTIFEQAATVLKDTSVKTEQRFTGKPPRKSDLAKASKKMVFYLAWARDFDDEEWDSLVGAISTIIAHH